MNANRLVSIVFVLLTAGVLALGWFIGISPKLAEAARSDSDRAVVMAQNVAYEATVTRLAAQFENIDVLRDQLEELQRYIPDAQELEDVLDSIAGAAAAAGVVVRTIDVQEGAPFAPEAAASTGSALFAVPISMAVEGPLGPAMAFIDNLQKLNRVFFVGRVTYVGATPLTSLTGSVFVITDPAKFETSVPEVAPTPPPTETPTPTPTPTASEG